MKCRPSAMYLGSPGALGPIVPAIRPHMKFAERKLRLMPSRLNLIEQGACPARGGLAFHQRFQSRQKGGVRHVAPDEVLENGLIGRAAVCIAVAAGADRAIPQIEERRLEKITRQQIGAALIGNANL